MNKTDGITERLKAQADSELLAEIEAAAVAFYGFLDDGKAHTFMAIGVMPQEPVEVHARLTFNALKKLAFKVNQLRKQEAVITEFLAKVERLDQEMDGLRKSIPA